MIITISSLKGGVGKTTIAAFVAQALKAMGKSVLAVDLDHNNNLTDYALREVDTEKIEARNVRQVLTRKATAKECIWAGDIIPATPSLAQVGYELAMDGGAVLRFRKNMRELEGYDYVIIDTPPSLCIELSAGLYAADMVLVPISASRWTVQGYQVIEAEVVKVGDTLGKAPRMLAVPSMVTEVEAAALRTIDTWRTTATEIRRDTAIREAASAGRMLRDGTHGAEWFSALAREVMA
jgi:chromosome partitioning protein